MNDLEKAMLHKQRQIELKEDNSFEKSDIMSSLDSGSLKISKTGLEIKNQIQKVILPKLNLELEIEKQKSVEILKLCGKPPTKRNPDEYWSCGLKLDLDFKIYNYDEFYRRDSIVSTLSVEDAKDKYINEAENDEQSNARERYNESISRIYSISVDIKACNILNSLKDKAEYELSPRQIIVFDF